MTAEPRAIGPELAALWHAIAPRMAALAIYNPTLEIQTTEFRRHGGWTVGIVVTPWFMNVVAVPDAPEALPAPGATATLSLPAGEIEAIVADLDGFGRLASASLFSPMDVFEGPDATRATAEAAFFALFEAAEQPPSEPPKPALDRRRLLLGRRLADKTT